MLLTITITNYPLASDRPWLPFAQEPGGSAVVQTINRSQILEGLVRLYSHSNLLCHFMVLNIQSSILVGAGRLSSEA